MRFDRSLDAPYGEAVALSPLVSRLLAANPGPFTFKGTGVYILGAGKAVAVVDPGPDDPGHVEALKRAIGKRRVSHILVTHTHRDHSPAAAALKAWSGATVHGLAPLAHGAVLAMTDACREAGLQLPQLVPVGEDTRGLATRGRLVIAPPSAMNTPWLDRFPGAASAMVSGWMRVRGTRRWKGVDRGFVLSDHADWPDLLSTITGTGARHVLATHGYSDVLARVCVEHGLEAGVLDGGFTGEEA